MPPPSPLLPAERPRASIAKVLLRVATSGLAFALVFHFADLEWSSIVTGLARVGPGHWALALGAFLGVHALGALKWRYFLSLAGARLPAGQALRFYAAGLFSNLCLPSIVGGDAVRAGLAMGASHSKAAVILGGALDRFADLVALGVVVCAGALAAPDALSRMELAHVDPWSILLAFFGVLAAGLVVGLVVLRVRPPSTWPVLREKGQSLERALLAARARPGGVLLGLLACVALQSALVLINVYLAQLMQVGLAMELWFLLWPLAKIASMLPISLGGIGVRELALAALVSPFGEEVRALAVSQSLVWQTILVAGGVAGGVLWLATGLSHGERRADSVRGEHG